MKSFEWLNSSNSNMKKSTFFVFHSLLFRWSDSNVDKKSSEFSSSFDERLIKALTTTMTIELNIMFIISRRWASVNSILNEEFEDILSRWIFSMISKMKAVSKMKEIKWVSSIIESEMFKRFLNVFEMKSFSKIDEKWTIVFSKILIMRRSRILSIAHSIDHERETSLKEIERIRSTIEVKARKCRRQISSICNLIKRFISETYWWSVFTNSLIWCAKTTVSRNISIDCCRLKNVRVSAEDFQRRKPLAASYRKWSSYWSDVTGFY